MSDWEFTQFLKLLMCSDPWPMEGDEGVQTKNTLTSWANKEAQKRGFDNWIQAYHEFT